MKFTQHQVSNTNLVNVIGNIVKSVLTIMIEKLTADYRDDVKLITMDAHCKELSCHFDASFLNEI